MFIAQYVCIHYNWEVGIHTHDYTALECTPPGSLQKMLTLRQKCRLILQEQDFLK